MAPLLVCNFPILELFIFLVSSNINPLYQTRKECKHALPWENRSNTIGLMHLVLRRIHFGIPSQLGVHLKVA